MLWPDNSCKRVVATVLCRCEIVLSAYPQLDQWAGTAVRTALQSSMPPKASGKEAASLTLLSHASRGMSSTLHKHILPEAPPECDNPGLLRNGTREPMTTARLESEVSGPTTSVGVPERAATGSGMLFFPRNRMPPASRRPGSTPSWACTQSAFFEQCVNHYQLWRDCRQNPWSQLSVHSLLQGLGVGQKRTKEALHLPYSPPSPWSTSCTVPISSPHQYIDGLP